MWHLATWNVRSVLDVEGSVETAVDRAVKRQPQKTKEKTSGWSAGQVWSSCWYFARDKVVWSKVYKVGENLMLTAGRDVPGAGHEGENPFGWGSSG